MSRVGSINTTWRNILLSMLYYLDHVTQMFILLPTHTCVCSQVIPPRDWDSRTLLHGLSFTERTSMCLPRGWRCDMKTEKCNKLTHSIKRRILYKKRSREKKNQTRICIVVFPSLYIFYINNHSRLYLWNWNDSHTIIMITYTCILRVKPDWISISR